LDNQIWKWFVISCTTLSGNWNGNHTIHEINYFFLNPEFKKTVSIYEIYPPRSKKSSIQKVPFTIRQ
jgi:hypothetical protein